MPKLLNLSAAVKDTKRLVEEAAAQLAAANEASAALRREMERKLADAAREIAVAATRLEERRARMTVLEQLASEGSEEPAVTSEPVGKRRGGRGMSTFWREAFAGLPITPAAGGPVDEGYRIVHAHTPGTPPANIRSQLNAWKDRGWVERTDDGWRLLRALGESDAVPENEAADSDEPSPPSEAEAAGEDESAGVLAAD